MRAEDLPGTEVLFARLPAELVAWVREQSDRAGVSMAAATGMILAYCRDAGLTLERPRPAGLIRPASGQLARPEVS